MTVQRLRASRAAPAGQPCGRQAVEAQTVALGGEPPDAAENRAQHPGAGRAGDQGHDQQLM